MWLSLVERYVRDVEGGGSNPLTRPKMPFRILAYYEFRGGNSFLMEAPIYVGIASYLSIYRLLAETAVLPNRNARFTIKLMCKCGIHCVYREDTNGWRPDAATSTAAQADAARDSKVVPSPHLSSARDRP